MLVQPVLPTPPPVDPISPEGVLVVVQQVAIGVVMGVILQVTFAALILAGQTIATSMGLGFASAIDPQNGVQVTVVGQYYLILANLIFLSLNGHLVVIDILVTSFHVIPIGSNPISAEIFSLVAIWGTKMFAGSLLIALPIVAGVLLVNLAFGVLTRAAPQLNIFAVGFPVTILVGFILMIFSVPVLQPVLLDLFESTFLLMRNLFN